MGYLILPRRDEIAIGRVLVMRSLLVLFLAILLPPAAYATVMADESKIRTLLKSPKKLDHVLGVHRRANSERSGAKVCWEYFERDGRPWGRRIPPLAIGNCLSELQCELMDSVCDGAIRS